MSLFKKSILSIVFFTCLATSILVGITHYKIGQNISLTSSMLLTIEPGTSFNRFTRLLVKKGVISSRFWIRNYARLNSQVTNIKAGTYQLTANHTVQTLLKMITEGREHQFSITFVEGTTFKEWLMQFERSKRN